MHESYNSVHSLNEHHIFSDFNIIFSKDNDDLILSSPQAGMAEHQDMGRR